MNDLEQMDGVFTETRKSEAVPLPEVFALLGSTIRKTAGGDLSSDETLAPMQRAYLFADAVRADLESIEEGDTVSIPVDLLEAVRKDAEGPDAESTSVTEAMATIAKRFAPADEGAAEAPAEGEAPADEVAKGDDVVWGTDLAADDGAPAGTNWGPDPDWSAAD
jgi:hypothetical protein